MRRARTRGLLLALTACALACGGPSEKKPAGGETAPAQGAAPAAQTHETPVRGDWLVFHFLADPENLNPLTSNEAGASAILGWIFPSLMYVDPATLELRPAIAKALPQTSADHLEYVYTLRDDVTFSDGKPLGAEDVVFTMKAIRHPRVNAPAQRNYFESVANVDSPQPNVVRFTLSKPYFLNDWALGGVQPIPRHYYDPDNLLDGISVAELNDYDKLPADKKDRAERFAKQFNENYNRSPLGPGAMVLENPARDYVTGEKVELRRRVSWAAGHSELGDPYVDRIVFRIINDPDAALVALKAGTVDVYGPRPVQFLKQMNEPKFLEHVEKHVDRSGGYVYFGWNEKLAIFQDKRVRQALSYLVDKKNICQKLQLGLADPVESPVYPARPEYNQNLKPWPFDPAKAKQLLADAGWSDSDKDGVLDHDDGHGGRMPLRFELLSNSGNEDRKNLGLVVIDELKRAGIDASLRAVDWSILLERVKHHQFDAVILGWTSGGSQPPDLYQIWHSSQAVEGGSNMISYKNDEVDRILTDYRTEFDPAKRKALYDRFQEILYDEQPYTFVYANKSLAAYDKRFHGVTWYPAGGSVEAEWWVPTVEQKYH
ncbi:MAG TPA: peptide-binding protein [Myxococcota bacterium]|nr:peptide-binding protein [Myxococcota bacterium]